MNRHFVSMLTVCVLSLALFGAVQDRTAEEHFLRGKELAEKNCGDCYGRTQQGLELAIAELQEAVNKGSDQRKQAYILLADAYNDLAIIYYSEPNRQLDRERLLAESRQIYRTLYAEYPDDPEVLRLYLRSLTREDNDEKSQVYKRLKNLQPQNARVQLSLGGLLFAKGMRQEGLREIKGGVGLESRAELRETVRFVLGLLERNGCSIHRGRAWLGDLARIERAGAENERAVREY